MFTITNNGSAFYDPRLQGFLVDKPKLTQEANSFGSLSFTLYPPHPAYNNLTKINNILSLYQDEVLIGKYIPTYKRRVFNSGIEYKCKNIICLLDDYYYRTTEFTGTAQAFIESVLSSYNSHVGESYKIYSGNIHSASVKYETPVPDTCWDALQAVVEKDKGYFAPRITGGTIYLDYLAEADLPVSEQKIVFGENMTDLFIETDTDSCYSVLYPYGTTEDDEVVSIASVNGGVDYLENASAVAAYGRREKRISWTNVESPAQLLSLAQEQLSEIAALFSESVQLSAVDLRDAGVSVSHLAFLTLIDCVSAPHGYSHRYPVTRMETVLDAPQSVSISLGPLPMTLTDSFALERKKNSKSRGGGGRAQAKAEKEFKKFETFYTQTDEKFNWLATEAEWDELAQEGHVTAFTELTRTARYVEDSAKMELPYDDWKTQWLIVHPEDSSLTDEELQEKYGAWIKENPYAIYNSEYSDATRTERIIAKTGINSLGENETIASRVTQTADTLRSEIATSSSALYTTLEQSLSGFRSEVGDTLNGYSATISQSANSIRAEVHSAISDIYARIIEWEGGGAIEVREGNLVFKQWSDPTTTETEDLMAGDVWVKSNDTRTWAEAGVNTWNSSQLYEWADYYGDEVYVWKDGRWQLAVSAKDLVVQGSRLEWGQKEIWAVVDDDRNNLRAEISLTASRFYRTLTDTANGLNSTITQTASQIRTEVSDANNGVYSYINQEADRIESVVENTASGLRSSITQTASQIRSEVSDTTNSLRSSITQNADQISLKVSKGDISSTINQTAQSVQISASKINLEGYVTVTELDAEKARFNNLTAGTTVATGLKATFLEATTSLTVGGNGYRACLLTLGGSQRGTVLGTSSGGIELSHSHSVTMDASGGVITITIGGALGTGQGTANFNIADTAFYINAMSAQWDAARAKVEMPSQGTGTNFTVKVPSATEGEQETKTFTIQKGANPGSSGYASVALSGTVVGRIAIGDWYTAGENSVSFYSTGVWSNGSRTIRLSNGKTSTVSLPDSGSFSGTKVSDHMVAVTFQIAGKAFNGTVSI